MKPPSIRHLRHRTTLLNHVHRDRRVGDLFAPLMRQNPEMHDGGDVPHMLNAVKFRKFVPVHQALPGAASHIVNEQTVTLKSLALRICRRKPESTRKAV